MPKKGEKGFTLIELLVVIAILGVIAAVAIPNILNFIGKGDTEAARAEQHNIQVAVAAYMYDLHQAGTPMTTGFNISPGNKGDGDQLATYMINNAEYDWVVSDTGAVDPDAGGTNPLN